MRPAALALLLCGCGADVSLGGSVGEVIDLSVSRCEVYRNAFGLQVTYFRNRGSIAVEDINLMKG